MKLGDTVKVCASGRLARIVEDYGAGFYEVRNLPRLLSDPPAVERAESASGIYHARDLEPAESRA